MCGGGSPKTEERKEEGFCRSQEIIFKKIFRCREIVVFRVGSLPGVH